MTKAVLIDGTWRDGSGETLPVVDPSRALVLSEYRGAGTSDVDAACDAAASAFADWSRTPSADRAGILSRTADQLRAARDDLSHQSSRINGKPLAEAGLDIDDAAACFDHYAAVAAGLDDRREETPLSTSSLVAELQRVPVGVAALITPWNFPLVTAAWKLAPALAAGCTVVWKPSEVTATVEAPLGQMLLDAGAPPGVIGIVAGSSAAGAHLVAHRAVSKVSFTGSNAVGPGVMAAAAPGVKSVSLELGGKSAIIVLADSDLDLAASLVVGGIFFNAGQMCSATSRILVEASVAAALTDRIVERARTLVVGPGLDPATEMGPLTTARQHRRVLDAIAAGRASGARLLVGGTDLQPAMGGYFVAPTVFADPDRTSGLWRDEIFGPVAAIVPLRTDAEAVALANDSAFGLVASVVSGDPLRARRIAAQLRVGQVWINMPQMVLPETSWGGFGLSGIGRELGPFGLAAFEETRHVLRPV
jgi:betaine-aldehyde dehydrogenase